MGDRAIVTAAGAREADSRSAPIGKLSPGPGLAPRDVAAHQLARIHKATIGIVAEEGYAGLKVRDVVRYAEVSTRAFYEHFGSKEDCFLHTYDTIARRSARRIIAAQMGESNWRERPRLVFEQFVKEIEREPAGARLALIEAYAAGDAALVQAHQSRRAFEGMLVEAFARSPNGMVVPPMIVEGMVAGVAAVATTRLLADRVVEMRDSGEALIEWALCYPDPLAVELAVLDRRAVWRDTTLEPFSARSVGGDLDSARARGDRGLILDAVAGLAASGGYTGLSVPRIRSAAGVSRRKFDSYFDGVEDCYVAALELRATEALAQAARAQTAAHSGPGGVYRAIAALCEHVASDPFLAGACLAEDFPSGPDGIRSRQRLVAAITEQLGDGIAAASAAPIATEASAGAIWALFNNHVLRGGSLRRQVAATLSYLALAPAVGAQAAVAAIQAEQGA